MRRHRSGNRNDITELEALIDAIPPVRSRRGGPRQRPDEMFGDRAYDHDTYRKKVRAVGIAHASLAAASPTAPVWAHTGGSWNSPSPGTTT